MRKWIGVLLVLCFQILSVNAFSKETSGTVFVREKAADVKVFRETFLGQSQNLKSHGFLAYSLHRDLKDKTTLILTLKCSDLEKGVDFIRSAEFMAAMDKAGTRIPQIWYGQDTQEREYTSQPKMTGGIVIARNEVRDYDFWLKCFRAQNHAHEGRQYKNSGYSIHHLESKPAVAIVVHEASEVSKAPIFMTSDHMNGEMESTGVVGLEIWYGINIEEGTF
jgi:hypothetical protein